MAVDGMEELVLMEGYTLREAGIALGKALLTIRSWMESEVIPPPFCEEAASGYQQYARFELDLLAEMLARHETHSQYVSTVNDDELIDEIWVTLEGAREIFYEENGVTT